MYVLNVTKAVKKMSMNKTKEFSLKSIIKDLDFLSKKVSFQ